MQSCQQCNREFISLRRHWARSPLCNPNVRAPESPVSEESSADEFGQATMAPHQVPAHVARGLAKVIIYHGVHHSALQTMMASTTAALQAVGEHILEDVVGTISASSGASSHSMVAWLRPLVEEKLQIYRNLETPKQQMAFIKRELPYVEPVPVYLGERPSTFLDDSGEEHVFKEKSAYAWSTNIAERIIAIINNHPEAADQIITKSNTWVKGTKHLDQAPDVIADVTDGTNFLQHPLLWDPQTDPTVVLVVIHFGSDEVEPLNQSGVSRGVMKLSAIEFTIVNLPPETRTDHKFMSLAAVALTEDVKHFTSTKVSVARIHRCRQRAATSYH